MERFNVSRPTVSSWVKAGCPHDKIKNRTFFNLKEVSLWVKQERRALSDTGGGDHRSLKSKLGGLSEKDKLVAATDIELAQARAKLRKDLAAAEKAELDLEERKGQLISREEMQLQVLAKIARARAVLLGGPGVLSQDTTGDQEHDEELLSDWVHRALTELSTDEDA